MFRSNANIILSNIVFDIFPHPREIEVVRYLFKCLLNFLMPTRAFCFIVDLKDFVLGINRDIDPFLEGKESKIHLSK